MDQQEYRYTAKKVGESVDPDTGEVYPILALNEPVGVKQARKSKPTQRRVTKGRKSRVTKKFIYVDAESMSMLDLSHQEYRVFSFMMGKVEPSNDIRVTGAYIARSIGMTQPNVYKALKSLRERLIIVPEGPGHWRINSWIAYTGEYKKWYPAAMDDEEPYWTREDYETAQNVPALSVVE